MKTRFYLVTPAIILVCLVLFVPSDNAISVAGTSIPDNEVASGVSKASNSSTSASIRFTMTGVLSK